MYLYKNEKSFDVSIFHTKGHKNSFFSDERSSYIMAGDITEFKTMESLESNEIEDQKNGENGAGLNQTEPLLKGNVSVNHVLQKPAFRRQASVSTFLCPDFLPGKTIKRQGSLLGNDPKHSYYQKN